MARTVRKSRKSTLRVGYTYITDRGWFTVAWIDKALGRVGFNNGGSMDIEAFNLMRSN